MAHSPPPKGVKQWGGGAGAGGGGAPGPWASGAGRPLLPPWVKIHAPAVGLGGGRSAPPGGGRADPQAANRPRFQAGGAKGPSAVVDVPAGLRLLIQAAGGQQRIPVKAPRGRARDPRGRSCWGATPGAGLGRVSKAMQRRLTGERRLRGLRRSALGTNWGPVGGGRRWAAALWLPAHSDQVRGPRVRFFFFLEQTAGGGAAEIQARRERALTGFSWPAWGDDPDPREVGARWRVRAGLAGAPAAAPRGG